MAKINDEYDIGAAFEAIENELMASMIRNMESHKQEEIDEDKQWSMWQTEMLKSLEKYKHENKKKYGKQFKDINAKIAELIRMARSEGNMQQEITILNAIKNGFPAKKIRKGGTAEFFKLNDRKLEALIKATTDDMKKAETAVLRMANDQYRKIIYNAQVYANTGAGTYEKAVDMATKDFLKAGLNCVEYANGARHTLADYADMAIRTATKRAYLQGEGEKRKEWKIYTVIMNKRGNPCPLCLPFVGKALIDDVWSGGPKDGISPVTGVKYPLMSKAIAAGLYHPRCRDSHTTYFEGISTPPDGKYTREELNDLAEKNLQQERQQYAARQEKKYSRLSTLSLDPENRKKYATRREEYRRLHRKQESGPDSEHLESSKQQIDKETLKQEIVEMRRQQDTLQSQLEKAKAEEKELTQKVYFDLTGTQEETESLKRIPGKKKDLESRISDLESEIWSRQETYKNDVEKRLIKDKILGKIKLSKKMTPETVDSLEATIRNLHQKYGKMPDVVYSPIKVEDSTATYNWLDDTIYLSNNFNDSEQYLKKVKKSELSLTEYDKHYDIKSEAKQRIKEADAILTDKSIKGYEREKARLQKVNAQVQLNETRMAVRENLNDCFTHEYGHFIHRHTSTNYVQKKEVFGMKELGGYFGEGDWRYEVNKQYSAKGKVTASLISRYADTSPYETFAEGFLAMEKGEMVPEQIRKVIEEAKRRVGVKNIAKSTVSDIMKLPKYENSVIPKAKFTEYALNPVKDPNKAKAFELALGYTAENADHLIEQIRSNLPLYKAVEKGDRGYGMTYEVIMDVTGPNGKTAKVLTAWIDDRSNGEMRLTTIHVD